MQENDNTNADGLGGAIMHSIAARAEGFFLRHRMQLREENHLAREATEIIQDLPLSTGIRHGGGIPERLVLRTARAGDLDRNG